MGEGLGHVGEGLGHEREVPGFMRCGLLLLTIKLNDTYQ